MRKKVLLIIVSLIIISGIGIIWYRSWIAPIPELDPGDIVEINHPRISWKGKLVLHHVWDFDRVYHFTDMNRTIEASESGNYSVGLAIRKSSLLKWGYKKVGRQEVTPEDLQTYDNWEHMGKGQGTIPD